ncbi:hypothetical protein FisN_8Lh400 [Fistulifera solaris]|uniref:Globin domain-containing protein n=1 Tax=Fistulifera solaris TaxID=1519565 RepID=A0A1Z5JHA4_FISSO|nr:hypothetical protein FisN_8Lh400 [Fistulifera solaris]|eukprot:GAX13370.1 hypothetical protein FisN_8Lh400 [Fistulifera solaris]
MKELSYNTISHVLESWESLRRIAKWEEVAGVCLFRKLFRRSPPARVLFGFPIDIDPDSDDLRFSKRFVTQAMYMIQMLDSSISMLGPDIDMLSEIMAELGAKHSRYGVQPEMFTVMGECLIEMLAEVLPNGLSTEAEAAWQTTYKELSQDMIRAYVS